jgi:hypothetical protein
VAFRAYPWITKEEAHWTQSGSNQRSFLSVNRYDKIHDGRGAWEEYQVWIISKSLLRAVLAPYLETLNGDGAPAAGE